MVRDNYPDAPADTPDWAFWLLNEIEHSISRVKRAVRDDFEGRFDALDEAVVDPE